MQVMWPTIFWGAPDYLLIQASAVLLEPIFSSSTETDTKKRNHINPILMESLQMLKFTFKKAHLDFTGGWITPEHSVATVICDPTHDRSMAWEIAVRFFWAKM